MSSVGTFVTVTEDPVHPIMSSTAGANVAQRFQDTLARADDMLELLVGVQGVDTGYLGALRDSIGASGPIISITPPSVSTSLTLTTSTTAVPVFDPLLLGDFPDATYTEPTMTAMPVIDTDGFDGITAPATVSASIGWTETVLDETLVDAILVRMMADLQAGATGIDPTVEAAMFSRARSRQSAARDAAYQKLNNDIAGRGFTLPSGALLSALTDFAAEGIRLDAEINNDILVIQGDMTQKNSQFIIDKAVVLETLIRDTRKGDSDRQLLFKKEGATLLVQKYAEDVKAFIGNAQVQNYKVTAQVEALRGTIESNRGKVEIFKSLYASLDTRIQAVASKNKSLTDTFVAEVQGYGEERKALSYENASKIGKLEAEIKAADIILKAQIAEAEQTVAAYSAWGSLNQKVSSDMAHVAAQAMASWAGSVSASASYQEGTNNSKTEGWQHSDHIGESHSYEHDPLA